MRLESEGLRAILQRFGRASNDLGGPYIHCHHGQGDAPHLVLLAAIHGDEIGGIPAITALVEGLNSETITYSGPLTIAIGNPEAVRFGVRGVLADLNRCFGRGPLPPPDSPEAERVALLGPILDRADLLIDVHQTAQPTQSSFWIQDFSPGAWRWVNALGGATALVTGLADATAQSGPGAALGTTDERVSASGGVGLTLELGVRGLDPSAEALATQVFIRAMDRLQAEGLGHEGSDSNNGLTPLSGGPTLHLERWREPVAGPNGEPRRLKPGLTNLLPVAMGQALHPEGWPPVIVAHDGILVFPAYPNADAPQPKTLYWLLDRLSPDEARLWIASALGGDAQKKGAGT